MDLGEKELLSEDQRKVLLKALINDRQDLIGSRKAYREQIVLEGLKGFKDYSDSELIKAAVDAGLGIILADIGFVDFDEAVVNMTELMPFDANGLPVLEYKGYFVCQAGNTWRIKSNPGFPYALHHGSFDSQSKAIDYIDQGNMGRDHATN